MTASPEDVREAVETISRLVPAEPLSHIGKALRAILSDHARLSRLVEDAGEALTFYAHELCEYGSSDEGCGHYGTDACTGCIARAYLSRAAQAHKAIKEGGE